MKNKSLLLVALVCSLALIGCKSEGDKFRNLVHNAMAGFKLPTATPLGNIVATGTEGDGVYIDIKLKDEYAQIVKESDYALSPKFGAMGFLSETVKALSVTEKAIEESRVWIRYTYFTNDGDTVKTMLVENSHLVEALRRLNAVDGEPLYEKDFYIQYTVDNTKPALPIDFGNGVVYSDIFATDDTIVYEYTVNGAEKEAVTSEMESMCRDMLRDELVESYSYSRYMIEDFAKLGVSFKYIYKNDAGELLFDIEFAAQEIADKVNRIP